MLLYLKVKKTTYNYLYKLYSLHYLFFHNNVVLITFSPFLLLCAQGEPCKKPPPAASLPHGSRWRSERLAGYLRATPTLPLHPLVLSKGIRSLVQHYWLFAVQLVDRLHIFDRPPIVIFAQQRYTQRAARIATESNRARPCRLVRAAHFPSSLAATLGRKVSPARRAKNTTLQKTSISLTSHYLYKPTWPNLPTNKHPPHRTAHIITSTNIPKPLSHCPTLSCPHLLPLVLANTQRHTHRTLLKLRSARARRYTHSPKLTVDSHRPRKPHAKPPTKLSQPATPPVKALFLPILAS